MFREENKIFTHLTKDEKRMLYKVSKSLAPASTVVEIGSYLGASSVFIAKGLKSGSKIFCLDTWGNHAMKYDESDTDAEERDTYTSFMENTKKYRSKIVMLRGWSYDLIDEVKKAVDKIDFLFIDGDHNYEGVKKDWHYYSSLLVNGSIVAFHDTGWAEGVKKVINEEVKHQSALLFKLPNLQIYKVNK